MPNKAKIQILCSFHVAGVQLSVKIDRDRFVSSECTSRSHAISLSLYIYLYRYVYLSFAIFVILLSMSDFILHEFSLAEANDYTY